jgi:hypothetical protein
MEKNIGGPTEFKLEERRSLEFKQLMKSFGCSKPEELMDKLLDLGQAVAAIMDRQGPEKKILLVAGTRGRNRFTIEKPLEDIFNS